MQLTPVRPLMLLLMLLASAACASTATAEPDPPMNIVVLYADDWRHDTLGVAGHPVVQTPTIDKLAQQGVRFTENAVTTSICGISRASLYTGQWMSRHGADKFVMWDTPWEQTYLGMLRDNGYYVGHVGKWHNRPFPKDKFDFSSVFYGRHWYNTKEYGRIHDTQRNEKDALKFLKTRPDDKPFYLTVAFFTPHAQDGHPDQFLPQPESMELYKDTAIPVPDNVTDESWERLPDFFNEKNEGRVRYHWRFDTPGKYQRMMRNYYRLVTEIDATCGVVLKELERQGVLDNTLVIFTTDNGYYHGEHGLADKWYPHQESIRVPLVIVDPRMPEDKAGMTNDDFTLNVDLAPTILGAAGLDAPKRMQGEDIAPLYLSEDKPDWRTEWFYEHPTFASVERIPASEALVRKDFKYMYWPVADVEQLFDLVNDPHEENDLAADPKYADKLTEMRKRFKELKAAAK